MSGVLNETYDSVPFSKGHDNITGLLLKVTLKSLKQISKFSFEPNTKNISAILP